MFGLVSYSESPNNRFSVLEGYWSWTVARQGRQDSTRGSKLQEISCVLSRLGQTPAPLAGEMTVC